MNPHPINDEQHTVELPTANHITNPRSQTMDPRQFRDIVADDVVDGWLYASLEDRQGFAAEKAIAS
jgi:hypothetical protein